MRQDFSGVGNTTTLINATRDLALVSPSPLRKHPFPSPYRPIVKGNLTLLIINRI